MPSNIAKVTLRKRRNAYGEFTVRAYDAAGARLPDADYYTDNWEDAVATAYAMSPNVVGIGDGSGTAATGHSDGIIRRTDSAGPAGL
jgi:hypothetical protein